MASRAQGTHTEALMDAAHSAAILARIRRIPIFDTLKMHAVVFDEGRPLRRRAIFPGYQMGRESTPSFSENEQYVLEGIRLFSEAAAGLPIEIIRGVNAEADDLVAALALGDGAGTLRIASSDRDFLQLVDERLSIYSPQKRLVIGPHNFVEATAPRDADGRAVPFPAERYLDYRAASGDASDDLPGIPSVGTLTAARLLAHGPMEEYFARPTLVTTVLGRRNLKLEGALYSGEARAAFPAHDEGKPSLPLLGQHVPPFT